MHLITVAGPLRREADTGNFVSPLLGDLVHIGGRDLGQRAVSLAAVVAVESGPVVDGRLSDRLRIERDVGCGKRRAAQRQRPRFLRKAQSQVSFKRLQVRSDIMHVVVLEGHDHRLVWRKRILHLDIYSGYPVNHVSLSVTVH